MERTALYIIAWQSKGPVKFGIASDPYQRMKDHQVSCPYRLRLYAAWWLPTRDDALALENACLEDVKLFALLGEWAKLSVEQAQWASKGAMSRLNLVGERWHPTEGQKLLREKQLVVAAKAKAKRDKIIALDEYHWMRDSSRR